MMFAMKVRVHITGNTFSQTGSDIVDANNVALTLWCVCIVVLVFVLVFAERVKRVMLVLNDLL